MARATARPGANGEDMPMAKRRLTNRIPIWIRATVIIALVLVGVLLSTMLLAAGGVSNRGSGGEHGSGGEMQMDGSGGEMEMDGGSGGQHGSDDGSSGGDHGSGDDGGSGAEHGPSDRTRGGGHGADDQPE